MNVTAVDVSSVDVEYVGPDEVLPKGWQLVRIRDVCDINPPKPPKDALPADAPVTFVPMPAVDADSGTIANPGVRPFSEVRGGFTAFRDGDVIFAKITPCMENGKVAMARELVNGFGFGSSEFHVLRPTIAVLSDYIYHYLRQESFRRAAQDNMTGSVGQLRVPSEFIAHSTLPLPPMGEQKRIVDLVESLLEEVAQTKRRTQNALAILKRFRQSVLAAACSGRLTEEWRQSVANTHTAIDSSIPSHRHVTETPVGQIGVDELPDAPKTWEWVRLPKLGQLGRGRSRHRPRNAPHLYGGSYPFIQTGDVARSGGRITHHEQTYNEAGLAQSRLWPAGTICITIAANIADSAVLTYPACFPDSVVGLIPDPAVAVSEFVEYFIRTARRDLSQFAPATAQKNINLEILGDVRVPLPPLVEQEEIVRRGRLLFRLATRTEERVEAASAQAERLVQAILAKAFRGELVATEAELAKQEGRQYEPASAVVERALIERSEEVTGAWRPERRKSKPPQSPLFTLGMKRESGLGGESA